jgi:hypothetical protein
MKQNFDGALALDALCRDPRFEGGKVNPTKIRRWIKRGLSGVRLRALSVGREYFVRPEDLVAFSQQVAEARVTKPSVVQAGKPDADKLRAALRTRGLI